MTSRVWAGGSLLGLALSASLLGAVVAAQETAVPAALRPPEGMVPLFRVRAEGVQVYECKAGGEGRRPEWVLKGPDAELFDERGEKVGKHYGGPTWEDKDGSKIVAEKVAAHDAPGGAVAWLLLRVKTREGAGRMAAVTYVQRLDTWAGQSPPAPTMADVGRTVRVKYEATDVFFGPRKP
jgi:hypothetical protein